MALKQLVRGLELDLDELPFTKAQLTAAQQAVIDWFQDPTVKSDVSGRIDTATSPLTLTALQKKKLVKRVLEEELLTE